MQDRDYTLIIDKSGSMSTPDQPGGRSRWDAAQESTLALARKCEQFDTITIDDMADMTLSEVLLNAISD